MKKLIFLFALFSLTFMTAVAKSSPPTPKGEFVQVEQVSVVLPVMAVRFETARVVLNFKAVDVGNTGYRVNLISVNPTPCNLIDPGIYAQVSLNNNLRIYSHSYSYSYSYTPYLLLTTNYSLPTPNYLPSIRHV